MGKRGPKKGAVFSAQAKPATSAYRKARQMPTRTSSRELREAVIEATLRGLPTKKIASDLNTTPIYVRNMMAEPAVKAAIDEGFAEMRREAFAAIKAKSRIVAESLVYLATSMDVDPAVRVRACAQILDRIGVTPEITGTQMQTMITVVDGVRQTYGLHVAARIETRPALPPQEEDEDGSNSSSDGAIDAEGAALDAVPRSEP